jgi:NitT/TauT family transport system ATP-binding protein
VGTTGGGIGFPIVVSGVTKRFGDGGGGVEALAGVDVRIEAGQFLAVLGPSGCGKSTLMALIGGLDKPTTGDIRVDGRLIDGPLTSAGVMFQRDLLLDWRTALGNVLLQFEMRGIAAKPHRYRAMQLLEVCGVSQFADRYPRELSGGMRQRVAICRALVHEPPLLLMDEPFGALDAITREELNLELARLTQASGATVVFVTHAIDEAVFLSDRVLVMSRRPGRVLLDLAIDLPRPRAVEVREDPRFVALVAHLRHVLADDGAYFIDRRTVVKDGAGKVDDGHAFAMEVQL